MTTIKKLQYGAILQVEWNTEKDEYTEEDLTSIEELPEAIELTDREVDHINAEAEDEEDVDSLIIKLLENETGWLVESWKIV